MKLPISKKQKVLIGDLAIGAGLLTLAVLLKDASAEAQTSGMVTAITAIFLRVQTFTKNKCSSTDCQ